MDEMRAQRVKLAEELRAETHGDDITAKLMAQTQQKADGAGGHDEDALRKVFDVELKKYEPKIKVRKEVRVCHLVDIFGNIGNIYFKFDIYNLHTLDCSPLYYPLTLCFVLVHSSEWRPGVIGFFQGDTFV